MQKNSAALTPIPEAGSAKVTPGLLCEHPLPTTPSPFRS